MDLFFKRLIDVSSDIPKDVRIAALKWSVKHGDTTEAISKQDNIDYKIKQKRNLYIVTLENGLKKLEVRMMALSNTEKIGENKKSASHFQGNFWYRFTKEEVIAFVDSVQDENPIHRTEEAVVPGCLVLKKLAESYPEATTIELRFVAPVTINEDIYLHCEDEELTLQKEKAVILTGSVR